MNALRLIDPLAFDITTCPAAEPRKE